MLPKYPPIRDEAYKRFVRDLPCCICYDPNVTWWWNSPRAGECHHYGRKGMGQKCSDDHTVPICHNHHMVIESPKMSAKRFQKKYHVDFEKLGKMYRKLYCKVDPLPTA